MMARLFSGSRRIEALERALAGLPEAVAMLRDQVAVAIDRSDATSAAVGAIGERLDRLAQQAADGDRRRGAIEDGGAELGTRMDTAERATAEALDAVREQLEQLEAAARHHAAALRDADISLLRLDRQIEAQARESRTLAEAVMHRIAFPPSS